MRIPTFNYEKLTKKNQRQADWLKKHYHGLTWGDGSITFNSVRPFLKQNIGSNTTVIVKGAEKTKWIKEILGEENKVLNIEQSGCPNLKCLQNSNLIRTRCHHHHNGTCALENCFLVREFVFVNNIM